MNSTSKVIGIVVTGIVMSIALPQIININTSKNFESSSENINRATTTSVAVKTEEVDQATPVVQEKVVEEPKQEVQAPKQEVQAPKQVEQAEPIVYEGMTLKELAEKLNRSLKSTLAGTGLIFANDAVTLGIDPYLAVGIVLHETGCNYSCSKLARENYNFGGMKASSGNYQKFNSVEEGIHAFMNNLSKKYVLVGLDTAEKMNSKYAASKTWATKVNNYKEKVKNA